VAFDRPSLIQVRGVGSTSEPGFPPEGLGRGSCFTPDAAVRFPGQWRGTTQLRSSPAKGSPLCAEDPYSVMRFLQDETKDCCKTLCENAEPRAFPPSLYKQVPSPDGEYAR